MQMLSEGIEVGIVTTNLDAMTKFYEGFLGLPLQGEISFEGGRQRRYGVGASVLKLVVLDTPPALPVEPGGSAARAGIRYLTFGVADLSGEAARIAASPYELVVPLTQYGPIPDFGFLYVADPDGNWIEIYGATA